MLSVLSVSMLGPLMSIIFRTDAGEAAKKSIESSETGKLVTKLLTDAIEHHGQLYAVAICCVLILTTTLLKNVLLYLSSYISVPIRSSIIIHLKNDLFAKILTLPIGFFTEQRKGDIMSRMTNDIAQIEGSIINMLEGLIKDPITLITMLIALIQLSPSLSLFLLLLLPLTALIIGRISRSLKKQSNAVSLRVGDTLSILDETLTGMRIIKGFCAEQAMYRRFVDINNSLLTISKKISARRDLASPLTEFLGVIILCIIIFFGANLVISQNKLQAGDLIAYIALFALMINPAKALSSSFFQVQAGVAAIERVEDLLNMPVHLENNGTLKLEEFKEGIEFRNVSFGYNDNQVLTDISFRIPKGKKVALVGSSGAGKSTIADLTARFYDASNGEILVDGTNIKEYDITSIRKHIGIVTQESILFNDTISGNIKLAKPDASDSEVRKAAEMANTMGFISSKPEQFETNIGDRGTKLSGGERQRLTIARAVINNPAILILDEATSSLDTESEKMVQDAINNTMVNRTSLIIAHRLSTVKNADEILVLEKGKIVERGSHDVLMRIPNGYYKRLVDIQLMS